jgi:hypothetical protein
VRETDLALHLCLAKLCPMTAEAGGGNVDRMQQPCCMEDGGRPSGGGLQDKPPNRLALLGDSAPDLAPGNLYQRKTEFSQSKRRWSIEEKPCEATSE